MQTVSHFLHDTSTCSVYLNADSHVHRVNATRHDSYCETRFAWLWLKEMAPQHGKHARLNRKFSYGWVYFTPVYSCKRTTVVPREDLTRPVGVWPGSEKNPESETCHGWSRPHCLVSKSLIQYLQSPIIFHALRPFESYWQLLFVFLCAPTVVSGALGCTLMLSLMSKCRVDSGKIQRDTVISAYVAKE